MKKFYFFLFLFSLTYANISFSQWSSNPNTNFMICDTTGEQVLPKISLTSDGGCYIAWFDTRTGNYNVYLQRLDPSGNKMFSQNGLLISNHPSNTWIVDWDMMTDNSDNAVIAFSDIRAGGDFKVYAYLISPTGNFLWGPDGVSLSTAADMQPNPRITQTMDGYYIIAWPNLSTPSKIAVQKLDAAGNKLYGNDPMYIISGTNEQYTYPIPIPGKDGSYIIGFEGTTGTFPGLTVHLYAQKYSSAGVPQWGSAPVTVFGANGFPFYEQTNIISDGNYGVVFVWYDDRDFNNLYSTFVQRIDSSGSVLFSANGVEVSSFSSNHHLNPDVVINHSTSEIYAFWIEQDLNQNLAGIYGQKLSSTGTKLWGNNGMPFKPMDSNIDLIMSALYMNGYSYVYYLEYIGTTQNNLAKAFSVDGNGNFVWAGNIVTFSQAASPKSRLVSDIYSNGVSVLAWSDGRLDAGGIYAQNIQSNGTFGGVVPVELISFTASQYGNNVTLNWMTATETNNKGFEIQRLQDYNNSELQNWTTIGFVEGKGTTTEPSNYSFNDIINPGIYEYRLKQIDFDGTSTLSEIILVEYKPINKFSLEQNYPNPFNPGTKISWQLPVNANVTLKIFNVVGKEIQTLIDNQFQETGLHSIDFIANSYLPSGVYFYQVKVYPVSDDMNPYIETRKMILLK